MQYIDKKFLIKNVAERWRILYEPIKDDAFKDRKDIYEKLSMLGENASEKDVIQIIHAHHKEWSEFPQYDLDWTNIQCGECRAYVDACISFGFGRSQMPICFKCLIKGANFYIPADEPQSIIKKILNLFK